MREEWTRVIPDGRRVTYIYQPMPNETALISAQAEDGSVAVMITLIGIANPLSRDEVERHFEIEFPRH